jgi:hypothetical protein
VKNLLSRRDEHLGRQGDSPRVAVSFGAKRAAVVNIAPTRAFVELRRAAASYAAIERRLEDLGPETQASLAATTSGWTRSSRLYVFETFDVLHPGDNALAEALLNGLPRPA